MQNSRGWWHWQQKPKGTISSPQALWANHLRPLTPGRNATDTMQQVQYNRHNSKDTLRQTQCNRHNTNAKGAMQVAYFNQFYSAFGFDWYSVALNLIMHLLRSIALFCAQLHCFALNCTGGRTKLMHLLMRLGHGQPLGRCSSSCSTWDLDSTWAGAVVVVLGQVQSNYRRVTGNQCSWEVSEPVGSKLTSSLALRWPHLCWKAAIGFTTDLSELCFVMCLV